MLRRRKHGTPGTSALPDIHMERHEHPAVRSAPNQDRRNARFIGAFCGNARQNGGFRTPPLFGSAAPRPRTAALQAVREFHSKIGTLFDQSSGIVILTVGASHQFERLEQPVEVLREKLLTKRGIAARPRDIVFADQGVHCPARERPALTIQPRAFSSGYWQLRNLTDAIAGCLSARFRRGASN